MRKRRRAVGWERGEELLDEKEKDLEKKKNIFCF